MHNQNLSLGHANVVKLLIEKGAPLNIPNKEGWYVIEFKSEYGYEYEYEMSKPIGIKMKFNISKATASPGSEKW